MKRRPNQKSTWQSPVRQNFHCDENEYDLSKKFRQISFYSQGGQRKGKSPISRTRTESPASLDSPNNEDLIEENIDRMSPTHSGVLPWDGYARLDDKLSSFNTQNDKAHTELRRELENKINEASSRIYDSIKTIEEKQEKFFPKQWYTWTIIGLVTIVGVWYLFSYINVHPLPQRVRDLENRIEKVEYNQSICLKLDTMDRVGFNGSIK